MTPLEARLREEIARDGDMPVNAFMARALTDPEHGYYTTREAIGAKGDFITAPEVSQMFGEIAGAWLVGIGEAIANTVPDGPVHLVELGPGRGTLMADILRVAKLRPELAGRLRVHLVEASPRLRRQQADTLNDDTEATWHGSMETVPSGPLLLVANEFFDALPVEQAVMTTQGWRQRVVGIDGDKLTFRADGDPVEPVPAAFSNATPGTIFESCPAARDIASDIAARLTAAPGAGLIIDYGYGAAAPGDTLQAVRRHQPVDVLSHVGEADLTAHVCFGALAEAATGAGADAYGPVPQARFLSELGIAGRAKALMQSSGNQTAAVQGALARLVSPDQMGALFQVLALTSPGAGCPPGTGQPPGL